MGKFTTSGSAKRRPDPATLPGEWRGATTLSLLGQTGERPLDGLTEAEVAARRAQGQGNNIKLRPSRTYDEILRENVFTFFNIVLFGLALLLLLLRSPKDAFFTGVIALFNVAMATVQEVRAKRKLDKIALLAQPKANVIREGQEKVIDPVRLWSAICWSPRPATKSS